MIEFGPNSIIFSTIQFFRKIFGSVLTTSS
jgi:hypothetical protein